MGAIRIYGATSLTGGTSGSLDNINGFKLNDGDKAVVIIDGNIYFYGLDADLGGAESSPDLINPDNDAEDKSWVLDAEVGVLDTAASWTARQKFTEATLTSTGGAVAWSLASGQTAKHTLTEHTTISAPSDLGAGTTGYITIIQGAGPYTLDWNATFEWGQLSKSTAPAADGDYIIVSYQCDGINMNMGEFIRVEA